MKRKIILIALVLLSLSFLCSFEYKSNENENIYLQNTDINALLTEKNGTWGALDSEAGEELSEIYESFISALPEGAPSSVGEMSGSLGVAEVFAWLTSRLTSADFVKTLMLYASLGILFAVAELFLAEGSAADVGASAISVILASPILLSMKELVLEVSVGISRCSEFFSGVIPVLTALLTLGSGGIAASLSGATLGISLGFVSGVLAEALLPLSAMIFSTSMLSGIDTGGITDGVSRGIRGIFNYLIGLCSLIIVGILGIQTFVGVSADNLALKSAKYTVSGMIPIVGSTVSGALSALISGVKLLSSSIGAVSVVALVFVVCEPLVKLLFVRFCLSVAINVSSFSGGSLGQRFFSSVRGALDTVTAVLVSSVLVYMLEIIIVTSSIRGAL